MDLSTVMLKILIDHFKIINFLYYLLDCVLFLYQIIEYFDFNSINFINAYFDGIYGIVIIANDGSFINVTLVQFNDVIISFNSTVIIVIAITSFIIYFIIVIIIAV